MVTFRKIQLLSEKLLKLYHLYTKKLNEKKKIRLAITKNVEN